MSDAASIELPAWALAGEKRRSHIARVVTVLTRWADAMALDAVERSAWRDAGLWHDALRDAPEQRLRQLAGDASRPVEMLHGPAAGALLEQQGETRCDVLEAIRWHTVGCPGWGRTGRALYMADYLEPGRRFSMADRAYLVTQVPHDFDGTFTQVVRQRLEWVIREHHELYDETVALWNCVR